MEIDFRRVDLPDPRLPDGFTLTPWNPDDLERHAWVKFNSFRDEIDSRVFPCLGEITGCRRLMREISRQRGFLPVTTWLITHGDADAGTIQGLTHRQPLGSIQNVGIVPEFRGQGLGRALVLQSLAGFRATGLERVYLEVTAENLPAVNLYDSIGFELVRTTYKAVTVDTVRL